MQRVGHLLDARLRQPVFQNRQSLVERHSRLQQMGELLGKTKSLTVRNFQGLSGRCGGCDVSTADLRFRANYINSNRNALLQFDLANSNRTICTIEYTLHEAALRVTRPISKLWHRSWILIPNSKFQIPNWMPLILFDVIIPFVSTASLSFGRLLHCSQ